MTAVPADEVCAQLGLTAVSELSGGRQSKVLRAELAGAPVVLKLIESTDVEARLVVARVAMVSSLAARSVAACAPVAIGDTYVHEFELADNARWFGVCYEFASGAQPDAGDPADAALMGRELASLHSCMAELPPAGLPTITGFAHVPAEQLVDHGPRQLLHGDFGAANIRCAPSGTRIFDFDDSGYGPVECDLAQALYVELFDGGGRSTDRYTSFRRNFLDGYAECAPAQWSADTLDTLIAQRVRALQGWLDDLARAPAGIRNSSAEWRTHLREFVDNFDT